MGYWKSLVLIWGGAVAGVAARRPSTATASDSTAEIRRRQQFYANLPEPPIAPPSARGSIVARPTRAAGQPLIKQCKEAYFTQVIDHFGFNKEDTIEGGTFQQRYFICLDSWKPDGPFFFYAGNEANVELYLNHTGLVWENAAKFGAALLFAEHRYYGKSQPFDEYTDKLMQFLSAEQALADYATLIPAVKEGLGAPDAPVVAFGGSYGGMLASWMRIRYPNVIAGAIAGSAPIWAFEGTDVPPASRSFYEIVTRDASAEGGSVPQCADNVRASWDVIWDLSESPQGLEQLKEVFQLCDVPPSRGDVWSLVYWIQSAWAYMAMGNYPYESSYILNGNGVLPPFPVRAACKHLAMDGNKTSDVELLRGMHEAVSVYYNYSGKLECYDLNKGVNEEGKVTEDRWSFQYCSEMFFPQETTGVTDMFWPSPWNDTIASDECLERFGFRPRKNWITTEYWGRDLAGKASNIVFSNGALDPWSGTGVLKDISDSVVAVILEEGAHHLDLMFSSPDDPLEVTKLREVEMDYVAQWIKEENQRVLQRQRKAK